MEILSLIILASDFSVNKITSIYLGICTAIFLSTRICCFNSLVNNVCTCAVELIVYFNESDDQSYKSEEKVNYSFSGVDNRTKWK